MRDHLKAEDSYELRQLLVVHELLVGRLANVEQFAAQGINPVHVSSHHRDPGNCESLGRVSLEK